MSPRDVAPATRTHRHGNILSILEDLGVLLPLGLIQLTVLVQIDPEEPGRHRTPLGQLRLGHLLVVVLVQRFESLGKRLHRNPLRHITPRRPRRHVKPLQGRHRGGVDNPR